MPGEPGVQITAVPPGLRHAITRFGGCDPRARFPPLPVDQALVAEQVAARVVRGVGRRYTLQLLPGYVIFLFPQSADELAELLARRRTVDSFPEARPGGGFG